MPQRRTTPAEPTESHATGSGIQTAVAGWMMLMATMVVGTALYGTPEQSERAFRILHWWKRDPEPDPSAEQRGPRTKRR